MVDDQRQYEQTYRELLAVVARLDALRRGEGRDLDPMATAAMHAASHAAWTLWRAMGREVTAPLFGDRGDEFLDLARVWASRNPTDQAMVPAPAPSPESLASSPECPV
ncbi:hypothetical protein A6A29_40800 [Streptomyces sp. TSRI0281]|nr:hypothetical protein A6A29_40800 [Streptomyces sp. TSRI0281]